MLGQQTVYMVAVFFRFIRLCYLLSYCVHCEATSPMQVLRNPSARLSCQSLRSCTENYKKPHLNDCIRRRAHGDVCRRPALDLRCCSVTAASQSLTGALAQPLIRDAVASVAIVIAAACLILVMSFMRSRGIVDRVSISVTGLNVTRRDGLTEA